jgi:hypothetical protein
VARALLNRPAIGFSAQVLQEFYAAALTKHRLKMTQDSRRPGQEWGYVGRK